MSSSLSLRVIHAGVEDNDPFSDGLDREVEVAIGVPVALTLLAILATLLLTFYRRRVTLPQLIGAILWTSQLTVALVAWGVTYTSARTAIEEQYLRVLVDEGVLGAETIRTQLTIGYHLGEQMRNQHKDGSIHSLFAPHPQPLVAMHRLFNTFGDALPTLYAPMLGTIDGSFYGLRNIAGVWMGWHNPVYPGSMPEGIVCPKKDYRAECGAVAASGGCNRTDGLDPLRSCFASCLPSSSPAQHADYCTGTDEFVLSLDMPVSGLLVVNGTETVRPLATEVVPFHYDPRPRPWFLKTPTCKWTVPYQLADSSGAAISMSCGVLDSDGRHLGAVGMTFSFASMNTFLANLLPYDDAVAILVTKEHKLVSTSMSRAALLEDTGVDLVKEVPDTSRFRPESRVRGLIDAIASGDGEFEHSFTHTEALSANGELILHQPVHLPGNLSLLLVLAYPIEDATGKVATAALMALVAAILISVVTSPLALLLVWSVLRPLKKLAHDMDDVAAMNLDAHAEAVQQSRIAEVAGMQESFYKMVQHLIEFRQYLPQTLLQDDYDAQDNNHYSHTGPAAPPPGLTTLEATVVFTDIRASTAIWEAAPDAMKKALRVHNAKIREAFGRCGGYEVKTIGDSFMVAFESATQAATFGTSVHVALYEADWPAGLQEVPLCVRDDVWGGLTVRVGMMSGKVSPERNELTGRVDYFGHTVNVASRLEGACKPGAVVMPTSLWTSIKAGVRNVVTEAERGVSLKGVAEALDVTSVWPVLLARRREHPLGDRARAESVGSQRHSATSEAFLGTGLRRSNVRRSQATLAVVQHCSGLDDLPDLGISVNQSLQSVTTCMERNGGTLLTVLGSYAAVGWNMSRPLTNHEESGVRFAVMLRRSIGKLMAAGMVSASLQHGDIGSNQQRFVTVVGPSVRTAWTLSDVAQREQRTYLYVHMVNGSSTPLEALPTALKEHLEDSALTPEQGLPSSARHFLSLAGDRDFFSRTPMNKTPQQQRPLTSTTMQAF